MDIDSKDLLVWVKAMSRGQKLPLDSTEIHSSLEAAEEYAAHSAVAYPGQTIKAMAEDGKYHAYILQPSNNGYVLEEIGTGNQSDADQSVQVVDAEQVVFSTDLMTTAAIGNISLVNGQAVIPAAGKNIKQVWDTIFVKEKNPAISQPKVTLSSPNSKAYEVGTVVAHSFTASFNPGSYEFGPATGVVVNLWKVTDSNGNTIEASSGTFPEITVEDDTSYGITASADHSAGSTPLTNIQNPYSDGAIEAGTKTAASGKTTGFRRSFYGTTTDKTPLTSDVIRGLAGKSTSALKNGSKFSVEIPVGAVRVVIAYPATLRDMTSVVDVKNMGMEIIDGFNVSGPSTISVEGVGGYEAIDYKVYVYEYSGASDEANTYNVTI